jgi:hypothetical protein
VPVSQFDRHLKVSTSSDVIPTVQAAEIPADTEVIHVGGPLQIAAPEDYEHPILVQFLVVQTTEVDPAAQTETDQAARDAKRARGVGQEVEGEDRWRGTVKRGELDFPPGEKTETRGVAVALLERREQFAFDTITWCDHVDLVDEAEYARLANAEAR